MTGPSRYETWDVNHGLIVKSNICGVVKFAFTDGNYEIEMEDAGDCVRVAFEVHLERCSAIKLSWMSWGSHHVLIGCSRR